jgi:hypothetical protein
MEAGRTIRPDPPERRDVPTCVPLVVHERRDVWGRQLRPRVAGLPARLVESRSAADLMAAIGGSACPVIVMTLGSRPAEGLDLLDRAVQAAPDALLVLMDPTGDPELARLARQLGATLVLPAETRPPVLIELLLGWICLAATRAGGDGWSSRSEPAADLIDSIGSAV